MKEGKLAPAMKPAVLDFMEILNSVETFDFAEQEGDQKVAAKPIDKFKAMLTSMPTVIEFGEHATKKNGVNTSEQECVAEGIAAAAPKGGDK